MKNVSTNKNERNILIMNKQDVKIITPNEKKLKIDKVKEELKKDLLAGKISGAEYNQKIIDLMLPEEMNPKVFHKKGRWIPLIIGIFILIAIIITIAVYLNWKFYFQNTLTANNVTDYSNTVRSQISDEPIQLPVSGFEIGKYKNRNIKITYKYYYDLSGVITSVRDYWGFGDYDTLVPRDICTAWGELADDFLAGKATFHQGERYCSMDYWSGWDSWKQKYGSHIITSKNGGVKYIAAPSSHNHLIPSTAEIRDEILGLSSGDKIRIIGYLVNVEYGDLILKSSTTKEDRDLAHSCEVVYVTKIERISK